MNTMKMMTTIDNEMCRLFIPSSDEFRMYEVRDAYEEGKHIGFWVTYHYEDFEFTHFWSFDILRALPFFPKEHSLDFVRKKCLKEMYKKMTEYREFRHGIRTY